jgi:hypothetical protein
MERTHSTTHYLWIAAYEAAVLEADDALMPGRIPEALAAIEQRLLTQLISTVMSLSRSCAPKTDSRPSALNA